MALTPAETLFVQTHQAPVVSAMKPYLNDAREALNAGGPGNLTPPVITGSGAIGAAYSCSPGTWANSPALAYQWRRTGVNIAGATTSSYTTVTADSGAQLTCAVTATNAFGSVTAVSNAIALATVDVTPPTATGFNPLDNATGVIVSPSLVATISETVVLGASGVISLKKTSDNSLVKAWNVATDGGSVAGKVEVVGGNQLTMYLSAALAGSTEHYIVWDAGVVKDAANNPIAAQASTTLWSFTTVATSSYDPATDAIAAAFTTPPTTARKNLIDACVVSLKSAGVWAKLDALYLFSAADSQAAKINWKAPGTFNCTEVNAPAFTADQGFTGASTKYLDSGFNPLTAPTPKFVQNSATIFAWGLTALPGNGGMFGNNAAGTESWIYPRYGGNTYQSGINQGSAPNLSSADGTGFFSGSRTGASATEAYKNGVSVGTDTTASNVPFNATHQFLRRATDWYLGTQACAGFGQALITAEHLALYNALNTYMTGVGVVSAYTGPGDLVSGAAAWYGLRGYSAAYATPGTNKAINIRRASDNATMDIVIKPDGTLDVAAATAFLSATTGFVTKLYDQSGNSRDVVQTTAAQQPQLLLSGSSASVPCMSFDGVNDGLSGAYAASAVPISVSAVAERITASAFQLIVESGTGSNPLLYYGGGATQISLGSGLTGGASDTVMHAFNGEIGSSGSSGAIVVDGTRTTGTTGSTGTLATLNIGMRSGGSLPLNGYIAEVGVWNALAFSTGDETALNANQHSYWGF